MDVVGRMKVDVGSVLGRVGTTSKPNSHGLRLKLLQTPIPSPGHTAAEIRQGPSLLSLVWHRIPPSLLNTASTSRGSLILQIFESSSLCGCLL
jgi:hypothetical protein